ncbi:putative membrane protein [Lasiodiplodia theobromae]|uniref:Putative membrane protein n=1 Tax=Lasiodiplodia theobromae TaxID=45133 RepID=A0A5N5D963_9PEZI|nr:putative membrane protein [Lasiodiplodia theobromae]
MASNEAVEFKLWPYTPSLAGGVIAVIVFGLLSIAHLVRLIKSRTWFCIPFVVGAIFETIGYIGRTAAHSDTTSIGPYVCQSLLILLAPILFAASVYMILSRIVRRCGAESYSLIRPQWVTRIFVAGDVLCFLMQSSGGGLLANAKKQSDVDLGEHVILGGLILQILIFGFFVVVAGVFHSRLRQKPTVEAADPGLPWERYMILLYTASGCITVRNVCRVVEYGLGRDGYLLTHEWCLYLYDFLLMAVTLSVCLMWYDRNVQPQKRDSYEMAHVDSQKDSV